MTNPSAIFTPQQLRYWMWKCRLDEKQAAVFLRVNIQTLRGYMYGRIPFSEEKTAECLWWQRGKENN